jgi:hypothetical protein
VVLEVEWRLRLARIVLLVQIAGSVVQGTLQLHHDILGIDHIYHQGIFYVTNTVDTFPYNQIPN